MISEASRGNSLVPPPNTINYYDAFAGSDYYAIDAEAVGWPTITNKLVARALSYTSPLAIQSALDLGAGTGISVDAIKAHSRPRRVVAVDASVQMLAQLRQGHFATDTVAVESSIERYVAECNEDFDLITSMSTLELVPTAPDVLCRASMLLGRGGVLAFTYMPLTGTKPREETIDSPMIGQSLRQYRWLPEEIERPLVARGLDVVEHSAAIPIDDSPVEAAAHALDYSFVIARASR